LALDDIGRIKPPSRHFTLGKAVGFARKRGDGQVAEWFKAAVLKATGACNLCAELGVWLHGVSGSSVQVAYSPISLS